MANIKTEIRRRKLRQQQKHTNQILGVILGEKNNRKLTLRHKKRKEYQPSFVISIAKKFVKRKVRDPSMIRLHIIRREPISSEIGQRRRRETYSNNRKNIDRNPNFVIRTNK
jgi:CRISPR/Cas system-associated endonuclease Cas1